jgi:hypothetical protein
LVQIEPPQPKFVLCPSLPQTLQPSEFVIFVAKDIDNSSNSEVNADPQADNFRFARHPGHFVTAAIHLWADALRLRMFQPK